MPAPEPAGQADPTPDPDPDQNQGTRRPVRNRHGRRDQTTPATARTDPRRTTGPRRTIGPPQVIPMTPEQHQRAIRAWAALIASWWTEHPPDHDD
jgi:hypothetical protein